MNDDEFQVVELAFRALWDSINGAGSWEQNPWVWALMFKRVKQ